MDSSPHVEANTDHGEQIKDENGNSHQPSLLSSAASSRLFILSVTTK
jgi:hypothetical protein